MTTVPAVIAAMPRQRVRNGTAQKRVLCSFPPHLLALIERDAERDKRTLSAQVLTCVAKYYAQQEQQES